MAHEHLPPTGGTPLLDEMPPIVAGTAACEAAGLLSEAAHGNVGDLTEDQMAAFLKK